jgi:Holliday junction resolvase
MSWSQTPEYQRGTVQISVPSAAVVQCFANYCGVTQHFWWIADPSTAQNSKRSVYALFDDNLGILQEFVSRSDARGRNARDLETAIAWLLWMLGFSVTHLGATGRTQEAPDLIATTPAGHFAVIECTTGLLKADQKLARLVDRTERIRRTLIASNNLHLRVLPIIVSARAREEIKADLEQAERLGVLVITREDIERSLPRTLLLPDAEQMYDQFVQATETANAKYDTPYLAQAPAPTTTSSIVA